MSDLHPTTKPVALMARMIANSSRPGEIVYDPFCGSGSTIVAAAQLKRVGYGCELDPGYLALPIAPRGDDGCKLRAPQSLSRVDQALSHAGKLVSISIAVR